MKLIFSRKGFDASTGGVPSPIFPDSTFCSFPIPSKQNPKIKDVFFNGANLGSILVQLTGDKHIIESGVHLDPDINREARPREKAWLPCFGQVGAAQAHLANQKVGIGDLFLFFGWFRQVLNVDGRLIYQPNAKDIHCIFGWLQVGSVYHLGIERSMAPKWASEHPHVKYAEYYGKDGANNTLYVASKQLRLPGLQCSISGGGTFPCFSESLQLTENGKQRSIWRLPECFSPTQDTPLLSYHNNMERWKKDRKGVILQTVGRGQEFVLDCEYYPKVINWLMDIFKKAPRNR